LYYRAILRSKKVSFVKNQIDFLEDTMKTRLISIKARCAAKTICLARSTCPTAGALELERQ